tara:strand:+ start:197 stop:490 length:294 start_codon:yes stop_codon:yes gene_type:complete
MSRLWKVSLLLISLVSAVALNLIFTRWGTMSPDLALLSFRWDWEMTLGISDADEVGIFTAPFLANLPWVSLLLGLILPLMLLGLAMYILVRLKSTPA